MKIPFGGLRSALGEPPPALGAAGNGFMEWFEKARRRSLRRTLMRWCATLALLVGFSIAGYAYWSDLRGLVTSWGTANVVDVVDVPAPVDVRAQAAHSVESVPLDAAVELIAEIPAPEVLSAWKPPPDVRAEKSPTAVVSVEIARLRGGPGTEYKIVGRLERNTEVGIVETAQGWHRVSTGDQAVDGWVREDLVEVREGPDGAVAERVPPGIRRAVVVVPSAIVRKGPGKGHGRTGDSLFKGVSVEILEERDGWIRVGRDGAEIGWVYERLLDVGDE